LRDKTPLYWLINIETYDFSVDAFRGADLTGTALIVSTQLWSIIRETEVYSVLIGPGIFKGTARKGNTTIAVQEFISALMFDPTQLRLDEPLPQVDIVTPEVIDPLGTGRQEEIVTLIRNLVKERGNVLAGDALAKVKVEAGIPQTLYYEEMFKRIKVSHISGEQRARFILGGTSGHIYRPFVENYPRLRQQRTELSKLLATPFHRFAGFSDIEVMTDWMIVEKAGEDSKTGMEAIGEEYRETLDLVEKNKQKFIFDL